ncbi:outer membrane protein assembly factor [Pseudomonas sp. C27(2019)]|uniref:autotransporter assembly complex protein TamA n=1 Tax=Pseudomonas sp. C27(2019) TaxID=2604941 RepID=UPI00124409DE|nr:autotransporter assembly complex family protein [Pseudomonas sp. C27(2019)]QEY59184.1 outer membrane protein assembly factor [Pseudomonas sp. C27(2019)]
MSINTLYLVRRLVLCALLMLLAMPAIAADRVQVTVTPKSSELKKNIEAYIGELAEGDRRTLQAAKRAVQKQARLASQALGYYQAQIVVRISEGDEPVLHVEVERGDPVRLRTVNIQVRGEAAELPAFTVADDKRLEVGARLDHSAYDDVKSMLQNQALRFGFFAAEFKQSEILIDPQIGAADINLVFDSGPRYRLGEVHFSEHAKIDPELLQRLLPFTPGTPYSSALVARLSQNLQSTGYFQQVRVDAVGTAEGPLDIPVDVVLEPIKPRTLSLGLGFSTDVGPRGRLGWERHRVNQSGHKLGFDSEISKPRQNISTWYQIPLAAPLTDYVRFSTGYQREELVDADSRLINLGVQWHARLPSEWLRVISLRWEQEDYDFGSGSKDGRSSFLMPGIGYSVLRSDSPLDPNQGYRLQWDVRGAKQDFIADADVLHVTALARGLVTFADKHRLLGRAQIGAIGTNSYSKVPPSLRFFAGGDQSVRGYDYQTLSPRDAQGNREGGRYMFAGSLEYQYSIAERWRVATFVDQGNAFNSLTDTMNTGVGFGLRWVSPVGPLRLDLAHALHEDKGWRIHFSMGPEL